ncbi:MAG: hypothetical protein KF773_11245 [Deltaproteobacteria bacterium]|nr:hypothetical protein [Deltaproteobacteria bacterium]MCW5803150.1 hypothetical protein [Deltaproteobacteria bacterium]
MKLAIAIVVFATACGSDDLDSDEKARRAYLALDGSIERSLALGFAGFNAASSANIDPQTEAGGGGGTLTITGKVDQGASTNKGMRLAVGMVAYTEGIVVIDDDLEVDITYDTAADPASQPALTLSLKGIPTGTLEGTLAGSYTMTGDIKADVDLDLTFAGRLMSDGAGGTLRAVGTTRVTGTATSGDGTFIVDVTL